MAHNTPTSSARSNNAMDLAGGDSSSQQAYEAALELLRRSVSIRDHAPRHWESMADELVQASIDLASTIPQEAAASHQYELCGCEQLGGDLLSASATRCAVMLDLLTQVAPVLGPDCDRAHALVADIMTRMAGEQSPKS